MAAGNSEHAISMVALRKRGRQDFARDGKSGPMGQNSQRAQRPEPVATRSLRKLRRRRKNGLARGVHWRDPALQWGVSLRVML